jgi:CDP-glucose 4,6-dehydratase
MENMVMIETLKNIYKGQKVFITGHTGFKGSWLVKTLHLLEAEIKGYALLPDNENNLYNLISGDTICDSIIADRNKEKLQEEIIKFEPDFIFHLAAQPLVRLSYQIPVDTFEVNAIGTANVLDALRFLKKKCQVILITTDKVYHNNEWDQAYKESDRLGGYDPYSASKACAELIIDSYKNSFFNANNYNEHQKAISTARAGNVIGGGDWSKDRLVPDIVNALSLSKPIEIRNPLSVRPWQHVLETIAGYLLLGAKIAEHPLQYAQPYNFGPHVQDVLTVEKMVQVTLKHWGSGNYNIKQTSNQPHEAGLLKLDITKALEELGWQPKLTAEDAVALTVSWYKVFYNDRNNTDKFTTQQIIDFLS